MSAEPADAVTFSDLSRNPRAVAERARRLGRLRVAVTWNSGSTR